MGRGQIVTRADADPVARCDVERPRLLAVCTARERSKTNLSVRLSTLAHPLFETRANARGGSQDQERACWPSLAVRTTQGRGNCVLHAAALDYILR